MCRVFRGLQERVLRLARAPALGTEHKPTPSCWCVSRPSMMRAGASTARRASTPSSGSSITSSVPGGAWPGLCGRRAWLGYTAVSLAALLSGTRSGETYPDLVERRFSADEPNKVWVADVTQHETDEGWLFLAVIIDVYSRLVVGWSFAERFTAELVLNALEMALWNRQPAEGVIHHSDHGSQYTSLAFGEGLETLRRSRFDGQCG